MEEARLTIEIENKRPIELVDLTKSVLGFADEFQRHLAKEHPEVEAADVKLYIKEIHTGSVFADLVAVSPLLLQSISYLNTVISFSAHLKRAYDYLSGKTDDKPPLEKTSYENLANIVEPIAKDHGSQLNIGTVNGPVYVQVTSTEANAAQNSARREIEDLRSVESRLHEKVLLYWYQARGDASSTTGDKGVIESIADHPVKVICANDIIKAQMVLDNENPFKEAYIVDVVVETIKGKPALYKILTLHDKLPRED